MSFRRMLARHVSTLLKSWKGGKRCLERITHRGLSIAPIGDRTLRLERLLAFFECAPIQSRGMSRVLEGRPSQIESEELALDQDT